MVIKFTVGCDPTFRSTIRSRLDQLKIMGCEKEDCQKCNGRPEDVLELGHYSKKGVQRWDLHHGGNHLNWADTLSDKESELAVITDQPCRPYTQLCLIRIGSCRPERVRVMRQMNRGYYHYGLPFEIDGYLDKLPLTASGERGQEVYKV